MRELNPRSHLPSLTMPKLRFPKLKSDVLLQYLQESNYHVPLALVTSKASRCRMINTDEKDLWEGSSCARLSSGEEAQHCSVFSSLKEVMVTDPHPARILLAAALNHEWKHAFP